VPPTIVPGAPASRAWRCATTPFCVWPCGSISTTSPSSTGSSPWSTGASPPAESWRPVGEHIGYLHDGPGGPELGFKVLGFSQVEVDSDALAEIWGPPHFDVPVLGLTGVSAGQIIVAARALFGDTSTVNRALFSRAVNASGEEALDLWSCCLQAGDGMAHFALGYTLYGLGRHREAYRHLRHYTEIAPHGAWNWCWYGKAAQALGRLGEARAAYERAVALEQAGDQETDARELLEHLDGADLVPFLRSSDPWARGHLNYWDYDRDAGLTCPSGGWTGRGADNENHFEELLDVRCPQSPGRNTWLRDPRVRAYAETFWRPEAIQRCSVSGATSAPLGQLIVPSSSSSSTRAKYTGSRSGSKTPLQPQSEASNSPLTPSSNTSRRRCSPTTSASTIRCR
jgi:hypothetical protein